MRKKRTPKHARKEHARRAALTVAAAGTATAMVLSPVTPAPKAEAATTYISTIMIEAYNIITGILSIPIPFPFPSVAPVPDDIAQVMRSGGNMTGVIGIMDGALAAGQAVPLLNANHGNGTYQFALIRNPGRANGGFASRFDFLYSLIFGTSAVSGNGISSGGYNSQVYDWGGGYDFFSDFPIAPNPFSIANSIAQAFFPVNLLGAPVGPTTIINQGPNNGTPVLYTTLVPEWNALLYPLRFPNAMAPIIGLPSIPLPIIGDPITFLNSIALAYERPLDIMINIGYSDVVTAEGPNQWNRTFNQFSTNKQFMSELMPIETVLAAVGEAADIALQNSIPIATSLVTNTITFVEQVVNAVITIIQQILGNIGLPAVSAATAEAAEPLAAAAQPIAAAARSEAGTQSDETTAGNTAKAQPPLATDTGAAKGTDAAAATGEATPPADDAAEEAADVALAEGATPENAAASTESAAGDEGPVQPDNAESAADTALTRAREQVDAVKEKLDAAADRAQSRADEALSAAQERIDKVTERLGGVADRATDAASGHAPGGDSGGPAAGGGNASPSSGDAAA